uniref:RING-type E3 ubiquitin transferase n=1 Tax=Sphenodon punctatus TaxID=8508 RepID=A0A8D0GWR0_SPHPU
MSKISDSLLSLTDCRCNICMEIFVEPVTLPCSHTLCSSCFQLTVEKTSLCCPFCRRRVSSWARHNARKNTLINLELWERIQKTFPEECQRRISGQDLEDDGLECTLQPLHHLSKPGELRQEYEAEIGKVEAERRAHVQEESKASEDYIQRLLAEEEEEQRLAEERQRQLEKQLKLDEELARELSFSLNNSNEEHTLSSTLLANSLSLGTSLVDSSRTPKNKSSNSGNIQRYLSPKPHCVLIQKLSSTEMEDDGSGSFSVENSTTKNSFTSQEEKKEEMPILFPPKLITEDKSIKDSFLESSMPYLNICTAQESNLVKWKDVAGSNDQVNEISNAVCSFTEQGGPEAKFSVSSREAVGSACANENFIHTGNIHLEKCAEISCSFQGTVVSTKSGEQENSSTTCSFMNIARNSSVQIKKQIGLHITKESPKRKTLDSPTEAVIDSYVIDKRRKTLPDTFEDQKEGVNNLQLQIQIDLEQQLYEKCKQEEQDRLLALQLQREIDKEQRTFNRQKGSQDEYFLRPKASQSVKESPTVKTNCKMAKNSKSPKSQTEMDQQKLRRGSHNENWQPSCKCHIKSPSDKTGKVLNCVVNGSDSKDVESLLARNKQKTILQMFKGSVAK